MLRKYTSEKNIAVHICLIPLENSKFQQYVKNIKVACEKYCYDICRAIYPFAWSASLLELNLNYYCNVTFGTFII